MNKSRIITFPSDWIKPAEFTFCGRCGKEETCTLGESLIGNCPFCAITTILFKARHPNDAPPDPITMATLHGRCDALVQIAKANHQLRNDLAKARKDFGLPPLFWMDPQYDKEAGWNESALKLWYKAMSK